MVRGRMGQLRTAQFFLVVVSGACCLSIVSPSVSTDSDYQVVFSEGLPWPDGETALQYSSARKFLIVGEAKDAAANFASLHRKLQRLLQSSLISMQKWARLDAAVYAREAELAMLQHQHAGVDSAARRQALSLLSTALNVCLNHSLAIECKAPWIGMGVGSCCSIAAACSATLQLSATAEAARMMRLAQRLTPQVPPSHSIPTAPILVSQNKPTVEQMAKGSAPRLDADGVGGMTGRKKTRAKTRVVLVTTATGEYNRFVDPLVESARKFFLAGEEYQISYVVFTDTPRRFSRVARVGYVHRQNLGWPLTAMLRYRSFLDCWHLLGHADYIFSIDVDCLFVAPVGREILADTVATVHADNAYYDGSEVIGPGLARKNSSDLPRHWTAPHLRGKMWLQSDFIEAVSGPSGGGSGGGTHIGFLPSDAVYETRNVSQASIKVGEGTRYYYSGFFGGSRQKVYEMLLFIARNTEADLARGVVARVHDESHVNRFWASFPPARILTCAYMYPEAAVMYHDTLCRSPPRDGNAMMTPAAHKSQKLDNKDEEEKEEEEEVEARRHASGWCPRDHMHPWLWQPFEARAWAPSRGWSPNIWNSEPLFVPRILNLAKVKDELIEPPHALGGERQSERERERASEREREREEQARSSIGSEARGSHGQLGQKKKEGAATEDGRGSRRRRSGHVSRWKVWSADMHTGPIADLKQIWRGGGMETVEQSLSAHCYRTNSCARSLKVLTPQNAMTLGDDLEAAANAPPPPQSVTPHHHHLLRPAARSTQSVRERFYEAYADEHVMASMDAVVCSHPAAACEIYLPLGIPIVLYFTTRFDLGRLHSPAVLRRWIEAVRGIGGIGAGPSHAPNSPGGVLVANNHYDAAYVEYFTGLRPKVVPSVCRDTGGPEWLWPPSRSEVLLDVCDDTRCPPFRQEGIRHLIGSLRHLRSQKPGGRWALAELRHVYRQYTNEDLAQHPAIVMFPYQVSVMSLFEWRAMGIPIFAPSLDLLTHWHTRYGLVFERRVDWQIAAAKKKRGSWVEAHPEASPHVKHFDPNDEHDPRAVRSWLALADIYTLPHVVHFDSLEHLVELLDSTDLSNVSANVRLHHAALEARVHVDWKHLFSELLAGRPPGSRESSSRQSSSLGHTPGIIRRNYSAAMSHFFPHLAPLYLE